MGKRSNGCITCRKRKVKCDETKPTCIRCSKATYTCRGYDQPWLDEARFKDAAEQRAAERDEEYRGSHEEMLPHGSLQSKGILTRDAVSDSLNLSAFREDICRSFVFHRLCAGPEYSKAMIWWLNPSPKAEVQSKTLVSASKAMSAAFFGRVHQQAKILTEGGNMYSDALSNLSQDLSHPVKAYTFETLGATMALTMYELVHMGADGPGWVSHAGGIGKLLEARGPGRHKTYPEKSVYLESRLLLVSNGIFTCQRTFLEETRWKDEPWEDDLLSKRPFEYLVDLLSDIPSFLQQITRGKFHFSMPPTISSGVHPQLDRLRLRKEVLERFHTVRDIREMWHAKYTNPVWQVSAKPMSLLTSVEGNPTQSAEPPFQTVLRFSDMNRGHDFLLWKTAQILLIMLYEQLAHEMEPSVSDHTQDWQHILPGTSLQSIVQDICRCTDYMLLDIHGSRGYIVLMFPATVAYFASDKSSAEAKWLRNVCKQHAGSSGFGYGDFALDQATPLSMWMDDWKARRGTTRPLLEDIGLRAPEHPGISKPVESPS
ncbi:hypothetical protein ACLMJK_005829 [Lecanora helva]